MKAKAIICATMFMASTMASAQTETKYYMNVQTTPDEVQSYEVNPDLKVSWEPTQKGATPSGYYNKDEVDAMIDKLIRDYRLEELTKTEFNEELHLRLEHIQNLLFGSYSMSSTKMNEIMDITISKGTILERLDKLESYHPKVGATPSLELMEENKLLKDKIAELERRLEALEKK